MSIIGLSSNPDENMHYPIRKKNVSGELDVFEATRYFSDFSEPTAMESRQHTQKQSVIAEVRQNRVHPETEEQLKKLNIIEPPPQISRGGGKLASFLNSLLRSAGFRGSKSTSEGETRRRRRSCVLTISGGGACREDDAPPRKSFDDKHVIYSYGRLKSTIWTKSEGSALVEEQSSDRRVSWRCEKAKLREGLVVVRGKSGNTGNGDVNDGCESDSSSDLFELNLCEKKSTNQETVH